MTDKFTSAPRRVSAVGIKIPTLPAGPLSVRRFHIEYCTTFEPENRKNDNHVKHSEKYTRIISKKWVAKPSHRFTTLDRNELQIFALLPPVDAALIRIVCTLSAIGEIQQNWERCPHKAMGKCVGLFQCKFW